MDAQKRNEKSFSIAISGYYGYKNSGDEAVLRSILLALDEQGKKQGVQIVPVVLSSDPAWTSQMYGVEAVHRMRPAELLGALRSCDGLISGGGSLLQDATSSKTIPYYAAVIKLAQWLGKPTFIYAQGIGPVNRGWLKPMIRHVMKRSAYVSVRDAQSAELLASLGVRPEGIELVPDPVMGMPLPSGSNRADNLRDKPAGNIPVVGVSLRDWRSDGADMDRVAAALIELSQRRAVCIRFLPFHLPPDRITSEKVMQQLEGKLGDGCKMELVDVKDDPQLMLLEVSRCDLLFGMRLHALIYAANQSVPMLGLSYDPKIDQFLARLGLSATGTTERLDAGLFADEACRLLDQKAAWLEQHQAAIDQLRHQSQQPAQQMIQFLRHNRSR
ncbi:polysaccharide pyruvyl transferase CsaB [Paenibacillus sp. IITD108]|uniref:polysaccharide pyruvyl transferase CsaB n=1 Tax=Paenibacillus sp. IITD108 TaxID=3116649 RepID=UPI002F413753